MSYTDPSSPEIKFVQQHRYTPFGTVLTAVGTVIAGVSGKVIKVHQYSVSVQGSLVYSLNNAKPTGGTVDFGAFVAAAVTGSGCPNIVKPFVPYPNYLCATTQQGSALCLGTYVTAPTLGTIYVQGLYTATDTS